MGIHTVPHHSYSTDLAPCNFLLFPKHRGCCYETIEEMKETVTKVIDTLTQKDFHGTFQLLLKLYNKCIAARGDYFEGDKSFIWKARQFDDILLRHCNAFYNQNPIDRWMMGCILPFPKKGHLGLAKNYRGITISSIAA